MTCGSRRNRADQQVASAAAQRSIVLLCIPQAGTSALPQHSICSQTGPAPTYQVCVWPLRARQAQEMRVQRLIQHLKRQVASSSDRIQRHCSQAPWANCPNGRTPALALYQAMPSAPGSRSAAQRRTLATWTHSAAHSSTGWSRHQRAHRPGWPRGQPRCWTLGWRRRQAAAAGEVAGCDASADVTSCIFTCGRVVGRLSRAVSAVGAEPESRTGARGPPLCRRLNLSP